MAKANRRPIVVFAIKKLGKIGDFILKVHTIALNIKNNTLIFVTPVPTEAAVSADVDELETAGALAGTRVAGSAGARDIKYEQVLDDVHDWQGYVQKLADAAADEVTAIGIIQASGFDVKSRGVRVKPLMEVTQGDGVRLGKISCKGSSKTRFVSVAVEPRWHCMDIVTSHPTGKNNGCRIYAR